MVMIILLLILTMPSGFSFSGDNWKLGIESNIGLSFNDTVDFSSRLFDLEYIQGFNNRPLFQINLELHEGLWTFYTEGSIVSLRPSLLLDLNSLFTPMVKLAFLEYDSPFFYMSVGRRKQSMGVSRSNLFVNRDMPFHDGINLSIGNERGFRFDSLVSTSNLSRLDYEHSTPFDLENPDPFTGQYSKYFIYHALSYVGETWYVMLGESAILANPKSLGDLSIFPNIHNENSDRANVGLELQLAKSFQQEILLYGMVAIDDLPALPEHSTPGMLARTPSAMAIGTGVSWNAIAGDTFNYPSYKSDKGIRKNTNFGEMQGGLILGLDYIGASRWMYIRTAQHHSSETFFNGFQSFYNYFLNPQWVANLDHFSVPYGFMYGGDSQLISFYATYESKKCKLFGSIELLLQGEDARRRAIDENYWGSEDLSAYETDPSYLQDNWLSSGNIEATGIVNIGYEHGLTSWMTGYSQLRLTIPPYQTAECIFGFGVSVQF